MCFRQVHQARLLLQLEMPQELLTGPPGLLTEAAAVGRSALRE